jgi:hypothetical protein
LSICIIAVVLFPELSIGWYILFLKIILLGFSFQRLGFFFLFLKKYFGNVYSSAWGGGGGGGVGFFFFFFFFFKFIFFVKF